MKVLIINPPWEVQNGFGCRSNTRWPHIRKDKFLHFPIYLAYAASLLKSSGIEVEIIDAVAREMNNEQFQKFIIEKRPDLCFIETSTPTINEDLRNARALKRSIPCRIYGMGPHISYFHETIMQEHSYLDGIIRGEFETAILDISSGKPNNQIAGLTLREQGKVVVNPDRELIDDLDALPFPAWDLLNMKDYESHLYRSPSFLMITSRGCPYRCSFCLWPDVMYGHRQRYRSAGNVCNEMEKLINDYGAREIRFDDDTFALSRKHVLGICKEIIKRGINKKITWTCFGHISQHDEDIYRALKDAGCFKIDFGIESGSDRILQAVGKSFNIEKAQKTIQLCKKFGLNVYCDFMIGFPDEKREDIEKSIQTALRLDSDYIQVSYTIPYPGTRMYAEELKKNNLLYPDQWEKYASCGPLVKNPNISEKELIGLYQSFWRRFYLRPKIILRTFVRMIKSKEEFKRHIRGFLSFMRRFILS